MGINKKGNVYSVIMIALVIFMVGMIMVNFLKPLVTSARSDINCDGGSITDGTKLMCLNVDIAVVYFILLILSLTAGVITDKLLI
jgi:hypothetical protein